MGGGIWCEAPCEACSLFRQRKRTTCPDDRGRHLPSMLLVQRSQLQSLWPCTSSPDNGDAAASQRIATYGCYDLVGYPYMVLYQMASLPTAPRHDYSRREDGHLGGWPRAAPGRACRMHECCAVTGLALQLVLSPFALKCMRSKRPMPRRMMDGAARTTSLNTRGARHPLFSWPSTRAGRLTRLAERFPYLTACASPSNPPESLSRTEVPKEASSFRQPDIRLLRSS